MYDPIDSSSPIRGDDSRPPLDQEDVYAEHCTEPTIPLHGAQSSYFPKPAPLPSQFVTQPTQIINTPKSQRRMDDDVEVQVLASSPTVDRFSHTPTTARRTLASIIAPPGTYLRRPPSQQRAAPIDLTSDPPVEDDSDEEETTRSNIKPSIFESSRSRQARVEETPQKRTFDLSEYTYKSNVPRKRPADDGDAPQLEKNRVPNLRQSGPARALPVQADIELEDIPDFEIRRKVERMKVVVPSKTIRELQNALAAKKGNYEDALDLIMASDNPIPIEDSEDELLTTPPKAAAPVKLNAKREVKAPNRSIQQKFSSIQAISSTIPGNDSRAKKKGRLVRGRKNPSPSPPPTPQTLVSRPKPSGRNVSDVEEDEGIVISSESEAEVEQSDGHVQDDNLLNFLNSCSVEDLVDLSNQKEDVVRFVLSKRPFRNLNEVRNVSSEPQSACSIKGKGRKTKKIPIGEKVLEYAQDMWDGYQAVDELVTKCEQMAQPLAEAMSQWGVDIFGAAKDGELALTNLDNTKGKTNTARDSGIGTPRSPGAITEDLEHHQVTKTSRNIFFLKKPSIMAENVELKDYQLVGLNWLSLLWQHEMSCILADDMGLGKTCQVIAFLSHLHEQKIQGPHLIIVPGSTLENWLREFQYFSPSLVVEPYYGSQRDREEYRDQIEENRKSIDCIVTTYDVAFKPDDNKFLRRLRPAVCVYDEGHVLRNYSTKRYKNLMRINADFRLLLTGTPLQNNLQELASILAFIMPKLFQERQEDLAIVFKHKAKTTESDHGALLSMQRINRARSMMTPFVLRRKKAQVLRHLPTKTCHVAYCELTTLQQSIYAEQLTRQRKVLEDRAAGIVTKDHANIMMKLRQAAIHPLLFRHRYNNTIIRKMARSCVKEEVFEKSDPDVVFRELQAYYDYECQQLCLDHPAHLGRYRLTNEEWMDSGKVQKLAELLIRFKKNGDRTLIFSQFTSVMDILEWVLETLDMSFFRLDGRTPIAQRQDMLDEFYEDTTIPVFMLSTKSGGAGINLACANKVIIFDSSFNPQDDIQAENRAHRVGQTKEVEVIRLVTRGTIEEQIHALGVSKLALDQMVAGETTSSGINGIGKEKVEKLSAAEEMGLEAVEDMLLAEFRKGTQQEESGGLSAQFLTGLKAAGLDMSAK